MELDDKSVLKEPLLNGDFESSFTCSTTCTTRSIILSGFGTMRKRGQGNNNCGGCNVEAMKDSSSLMKSSDEINRRNGNLNKHLCHSFVVLILTMMLGVTYTIFIHYGDKVGASQIMKMSVPIPTSKCSTNNHRIESMSVQKSMDDSHYSPTLLSIIDDCTNEFIHPSNNELYKLFEPNFRFLPGSISRIHLKLDKYRLQSFHEPLKLSIEITGGEMGTANASILNDDDVLTMHCSSYDNDDLLDTQLNTPREVATLAQVRATTAFHYRHNPNFEINEAAHATLYIPSFPTIREEKCYFVLLRRRSGAKNVGRILARSLDLNLPTVDTPTGIHLSLTNDPSEMVVQFITGRSGCVPFVEIIDPKSENQTFTYEGQSTTYANTDLCQEPANSTGIGKFVSPGSLHTVILDGLVPDTTYRYKVGVKKREEFHSDEIVKSEKSYTFTTAPVIGSNDPFAFIAFGDQGCPIDGWAMGGNMSTLMVERELDNAEIPIRAVHHFGDLSYARGNGHMWDAWLDMIQVYTSRVPLLVGVSAWMQVGNHEYDHTGGGLGKDPSGEPTDDGFRPSWGNFGADSGGECGVPTAKRFYTPPNGNGVFWYSFDMGLVHTIMLSSEHSLNPDSRQYKWLEKDLKNVNRSLTPWIIVESHRPMYHNEFIPDNLIVEAEMRREFENILRKYSIDLFLAGHFHSYVRTCSGLFNSTCNNGGPTHIVVGTAGAKLDHGFLVPRHWNEKFLKVYGYGKVTVLNATTLHWSFNSAQGKDKGKTLDEVWLRKTD